MLSVLLGSMFLLELVAAISAPLGNIVLLPTLQAAPLVLRESSVPQALLVVPLVQSASTVLLVGVAVQSVPPVSMFFQGLLVVAHV